MLLTYQYRLQPNEEQAATLSHWGELLRRHWNYALGQRLDYLRRTRSSVAWRTFLNILQAVAVRRGKHTQEVDAKGTSIECFNCEKRVVKDLSVRIHNFPNCSVCLDRDLNASLNILKRTVGQPFAACGGLVSRQPVRQELSFVNLRSPRQTAFSG
jgi:putative transposase